MIYIPKASEIKLKIKGLLDKFIINSQNDKANLIKDYISRLENIFRDKNADIEYLYRFVFIIMELSRTPLMNVVNVDLLREKFEERYIKIDEFKILKNKKYDMKDITVETSVKFEPVNYASESSENDNSEDLDNEANYPIRSYSQLESKIFNNFINVSFSENKNKLMKDFILNDEPTGKSLEIIKKKIESYNNNALSFDKNYKVNLFNIIIKDTKYANLICIDKFLIKENCLFEHSNSINSYEMNPKLQINVNTNNIKEDYNNISKFPINNNNKNKAWFHNSLKLEHQILLNSRLSSSILEDNSNKIKDFFSKSLYDSNYKFRNTVAFNNFAYNTFYNNEEVFNKINNINPIDSIDHKNKKIIYIDSQYLLIKVLNHLIFSPTPQLNTEEKQFKQNFDNLICVDLDKNIQEQILNDLERFHGKLHYLRDLDGLVKENNISSYVIFDYLNFISEVTNSVIFILNSYLKIALMQKGKLNNALEAFLYNSDFFLNNKSLKMNKNDYNCTSSSINIRNKDNNTNTNSAGILHDLNNLNITSYFYSTLNCGKTCANISKSLFIEKVKSFFTRMKQDNIYSSINKRKIYFKSVLEELHNFNIIKYFDWEYFKSNNPFKSNAGESNTDERDFGSSKKLTLISLRDDLTKFYEDKLDYLILISENMIKIKLELDKINLFKPYLFVKEFIDYLYLSTKQIVFCSSKLKVLLATEIFFAVIFSYLEIIQVFILNGNLIDTFNEFFLDHIFTKSEASKAIFNFNEKFKDFDWFKSFKIKSYSLFQIDGGCVPEIFKYDQINFKILETGKSVFLIKNLRSLDKINFDVDLDLEAEKIKKIQSSIYKEIHNIIDIKSLTDINFEFYEYYVIQKAEQDCFITNADAYHPQEHVNHAESLAVAEKQQLSVNKLFLKTNNLSELKKNIQINSEIEYEIYKNLPYNIAKKVEDDNNLMDIDHNMTYMNSNNNAMDIIDFKDEEVLRGMKFNFNINFGNKQKNNFENFNYNNIFLDEDNLDCVLPYPALKPTNEHTNHNNRLINNNHKMAFDFMANRNAMNPLINDININEKNNHNLINEHSTNPLVLAVAHAHTNKEINKSEILKFEEIKENKIQTFQQTEQSFSNNINNLLSTNNNPIQSMNYTIFMNKKPVSHTTSANTNNNKKQLDKILSNNTDVPIAMEEITELEAFNQNFTSISKKNNSNSTNNQVNEQANTQEDTFNKTEEFAIFNLDSLFITEILKRLDSVNKTMNKKLLNYLICKEKIKEHFELCFSIICFRAGFSMNLFVMNLLEISQKGMISDNFFLKNLLEDISSNSDLRKYKQLIKSFFFISINANRLDNFDTFIIKYKPNLPISIFYDELITQHYSAIFNFIFNIKRMNESFKTIMYIFYKLFFSFNK